MAEKRTKKKKETIVFDVENEQIILSQMINNLAIRKRCVRELTENLFIGKRHKVIFKVLSDMISRGLDYNKDTFKTLSNNNEFGGFSYLDDLEELFEENTNVDFHIDRLKLDSKKINLKKDKVKELNDALEDPQIDAKKLSQIVKSIDGSLKEIFVISNVEKGKELKKKYFETLKERQDIGTFVGTGFSLDEYLTEGMARKKVSIIAARPSMGKTTFLSNVVDNLKESGKNVLALPLETGKESLIDLMVARRTKTNINDIIKNTRKLSNKKKAMISLEVSKILDDEVLHMIDDTSIKLQDLRIIAENSNYDVILVDLFEKINDISFDAKVLSQQLKEVQNISKDANVHICLLAQIKRFDTRNNKDLKPTLELLKHSGAYEEISDLILFLHREFYYKPEIGMDALEVIIAKQRNGIRNKSIYYEFFPELATIGNEIPDYFPMGDDF